MTTWLKKFRLYLLRRQLKHIYRRLMQIDATVHPLAWTMAFDFHVDLIKRIAELEKTL